MNLRKSLVTLAALCASGPLLAQEPVVGVDDPESLFVDADPVKHRNKQAALHIMRDLLQCNHWDKADQWLTEQYIQHNPLAASGRNAVVQFFSNFARPSPSCAELELEIVAVLADDDYVTVVWPQFCTDANTGEQYTSTWFDMWRFVDGKADEHWDPAVKTQSGCVQGRRPG